MAEMREPRNKWGWTFLVIIAVIMVVIFIKSNSPITFLGWFTSVLLAITLAVVISIGSFLLICAVIHRFAQKRKQADNEATDSAEAEQPVPLHQSRHQPPMYRSRSQQPPRPPINREDNGC